MESNCLIIKTLTLKLRSKQICYSEVTVQKAAGSVNF
jgi:hypothetical protein